MYSEGTGLLDFDCLIVGVLTCFVCFAWFVCLFSIDSLVGMLLACLE